MGIFKFDEIAFNSTEKKKPVDEDKYTYLGLEHLDSDSIYVTRYGADVAPKGDKLIMKKGDVLFGKRRAYQKKVAIAPFDGIFSAHGMVLRPKEDVIDKNFFPMFIKSDYFLDAAIKISVGSLSPTINWRDLKELKFELPSLEEQRKLAEVLWAIYDMKDKYKKLILATDELVKSQFIEMTKQAKIMMKVSDFTQVITGGTPSTKKDEYWEGGTIPWLQSGCCQNCEVRSTETYITQQGYDNSSTRMMPVDTVMIALTGATAGKVGYLTIQACGNQSITGILPSDTVYPRYLFYFLMINRDKILSDCVGAAQPHISQGYVKNIEVPIIDKDRQLEFVRIAEESDKSKFALQEAIKDLDALSKKIIAENLIPAGKE